MSTAQMTLIPNGCKYATKEKAKLADLKKKKQKRKMFIKKNINGNFVNKRKN